MIILIAYWIVISFTFLAYGNILILIWNKTTAKEDEFSLFDTFWIGLSAVGLLSTLLSLFLPLNVYVLAAFLVTSILFWVLHRHKLMKTFSLIINRLKGTYWTAKILILFSFIIICILSFLPPSMCGDYDLYHLQSMIWAEKYSVVPGLGNLHSRFGFNSSFFLLTTIFSFHPDQLPFFYPLNGLFFIVFSVWLFTLIKKNDSIFKLVGILSIYFFFIHIFRFLFSSTSNDILPNLLIVYVIISALLQKDKGKILSRGLAIVAISFFCITIKLSSAPLVFLSVYILYMLWKKKEYKPLFFLTLLAIVIIVPWLARFVVLTGYLVYPFPSVDIFSFDWKVPIEIVKAEKEWITSWARLPYMDKNIVLNMPFNEWIFKWIKNQDSKNLSLCILILLSPLILFFIYRKKRQSAYALMIWLTSFVGFIFCFNSAPDIRFFLGFALTCAFIPFLICAQVFPFEKYLKLFAITLFSAYLIKYAELEYHRAKIFISQNPIIYPNSYLYLECTEHIDKKYIKNKNNQLFEIFFSTSTCFPSTPYYTPDLELRGNTFQEGFRVKQNNY